MRRSVLLSLVLLLICTGIGFSTGQAEFPQRDITDVVFAGAGGGTDTSNRIVAAEMAKVLGVKVNVINKTGGVSGSVAMDYVFSRPHDGYTICGISESIVTSPVMGGFQNTIDVWDFLLIAGSPEVISVTPDTPYQTLKELVDATKNSPNTINVSASSPGGLHHINLLALINGTGAKLNFIPYFGSAPSQTAAMTGEVSVVITAVAEQAELIKGKKLRPLAVLTSDSFYIKGIGEIPSAFEDYPELKEYLPVPMVLGMSIPKDTPEPVKKKITDAFKIAMESDSVKDWADKHYFSLFGQTGEEANAIFAKLESLFSWTLWDVGVAEKNPADFTIPKP